MPPSIKAMEYFTTALRHGNIAKAATELNIAASAIATAIDQVETAFGLTLVTRQRSRGIQATASGLAVAKKCEGLLEHYRAMLAEGAELKQALKGSLRIGYYAPVAPAFLPKVFQDLAPSAAAQPNQLELHLHECDNDAAQEGLLNGSFDVILFVSEDVRPTIEFDVLLEAPAYCLVPAGHSLARQRSVTMTEIVQNPLVVLNRPTAASYYRSLFGAHAANVSIAAYANSTEMVRSLVGAGLGCAVLNMRPLISTSYSAHEVVALPISDLLPPLTLSVGYDKSRPRKLVQEFVDRCKKHFAEDGKVQCTVRAEATL